MKKILFVISRYPEGDYRSEVFKNVFSKRNREFCDKNGLKYVEIGNEQSLDLIRNNPTWWKFSIPQMLIDTNTISDGDVLIHYDADIYNCKTDVSLEIPEDKSFGYSIDSGNTACMGFWSMRIDDWSKSLIKNIMDESRWERLKNEITIHDRFQTYSSFAMEFREQAMLHRLFGIKRHSDLSYWDMPNYGWHSERSAECIYSLDDLHQNVHIFDTKYNVTEWPGESSCEFNINANVKKEDVVLRHLTGCNWNNYKNWL